MAAPATWVEASWTRAAVPEPFAAAERAAIGTTARVVVWPASTLKPALATVDEELCRLDEEVSRFRPGSELARIASGPGEQWTVSERLAEAISVALAAARWTGGRVDPTVGNALVELGYDRDFALVTDSAGTPATIPTRAPAQVVPGWRSVTIDGRLLRAPAGTLIDLGATAKALGAERAAEAIGARFRCPGGALVSLGGDISLAGDAPLGGWPVMLADDHRAAPSSSGPTVRLGSGGLATSSTTVRSWRHGGLVAHHIVDPATGQPAEGPWRTVSVAAASCVDANAASTAAIVAGTGAEAWLASTGLPARLVGSDGAVVLVGGWPPENGQAVEVPPMVVCRAMPVEKTGATGPGLSVAARSHGARAAS